MRKFKILILLALICNISFAQTAEEIIDKSRLAAKINGLESISTLKIIDQKGRERVRTTSMASKDFGTTEKRIIRFIEPADVKGTGILIFDHETKNDDMWLYMPAIRKTRRIVSSDKSKNFMGSEFSNADMTAPNKTDFNYQLLEDETVNGEMCWKIEASPINDEIADDNNLSRKIIFIAKKDYMQRKAIYYNYDEELWKTLTINKVELVDKENKRYLITDMLMENNLNGRKSIMTMDKFQNNKNVKEEYFTVTYLENL